MNSKKQSVLKSARSYLAAGLLFAYSLASGCASVKNNNSNVPNNASFSYIGPEISAGTEGIAGGLSTGYRSENLGLELIGEAGDSSQGVLKAGVFNLPLKLDASVAGYFSGDYTGFSGEIRKSVLGAELDNLSAGIGAYNFNFEDSSSAGANVNLRFDTEVGTIKNSPLLFSLQGDYYFGDENNFGAYASLRIPFGAGKESRKNFIKHPLTHMSSSSINSLENKVLKTSETEETEVSGSDSGSGDDDGDDEKEYVNLGDVSPGVPVVTDPENPNGDPAIPIVTPPTTP